MTKKLALLTAFLLAFNASASSSHTNSLVEDDQVPDWSRTYHIPQGVIVDPRLSRKIVHFTKISRNHIFIRIENGTNFGCYLKTKTPSITFKAGKTCFGLPL